MKAGLWSIGAMSMGLVACGGAQPPDSGTSESAGEVVGTVEDGEALIEKGDFEGALVLFEGIVENHPDDAKASYYLGFVKWRLFDLDGAIQQYERAIELDDTLMVAHINLGLALIDKGDLERAESELRVYLSASPEDGDAHYYYGMVQEKMNQPDKAREYYTKASELNPEDPFPLFGLGDMARRNGKLKEAVAMYEKARALNPHIPQLIADEGTTLVELKELDRACEVLITLLEVPSVDPVLVTESGKMIAKHHSSCAIRLYEGVLSIDNTFAGAHFLLGNTLAREERYDEAAAHYEKFLSLAPDDPAADAARNRLEGCKQHLSK